MKKIILLATAMVCFLFTEAQTITKIEGKRNTRPDTEYANFSDSAILKYPSTLAITALQVRFRFEFTNGSIQLQRGDTIVISALIGTMPFFTENDTLILATAIAPNGLYTYTPPEEAIGNYLSNGALIQENDSTYKGTVHGIVKYVSKYTNTTFPIATRAPIVLIKEQPTPPPTAVTETIMEKVKFYPNPVTNELNVTNLKNTNVEVYNVVGQRLFHFENVSGDIAIEMKTCPDGIYFVRMQNGKAVRTEKIKLVK
jgi:hypothetical protein